MKGQEFNIAGLHTRALTILTGLATGYDRPVLVPPAMYQKAKGMCRLPDTPIETETHQ